MDKKISLKEIIVPPKDEGYELYRAIKTFCIIMIIFCMAIVFRTCYLDMLNNSRFLNIHLVMIKFCRSIYNMLFLRSQKCAMAFVRKTRYT